MLHSLKFILHQKFYFWNLGLWETNPKTATANPPAAEAMGAYSWGTTFDCTNEFTSIATNPPKPAIVVALFAFILLFPFLYCLLSVYPIGDGISGTSMGMV